MPTTTELIRKGLYSRLGINTTKKRDTYKMQAEISGMVKQLAHIMDIAKPRLIMGGIRYGSDWTHEALMDYMQEKFDTYKTAGNYEMLIDFVNFIAIEGVLKTHPKHHFHANDRKE